MKIELVVSLCQKKEIKWLDYGLESILDESKHEINTTLYLSRYSDSLFSECSRLAEKYNINFEPRGDNSPIHYVNEAKHRGFELNNSDCVVNVQPDTFFLKKDVFDSVMAEASEHFDSKYFVCVSSDHPDDTLPLGITIHSKLGWEKIGCHDINFYPHAGDEADFHRRCYLSYGLDPEDKETYMSPLDGKTTPAWTHRIRCKDFLHIGRPWHAIDPRLYIPRQIDYSMYSFFDCVLHNRWWHYYLEKWGGMQGAEKFIYPFDDKENSLRIAWESAESPYPKSKFISLRGLII
jgi:hypothetical protein